MVLLLGAGILFGPEVLGWIQVDDSIVLYLFGTPGQDRFGFMWNDLVQGALGAVVLVDSRRIEDSFPALDFFESRSVPYVVALNTFDGRLSHSPDAVREALEIMVQSYENLGMKELAADLLPPLIYRKLRRGARKGG